MATIYEVSKLAGVSVATVSRMMNNHPAVKEKTKAKVLSAIKALDYRPNSVAKSLASNKTDSVGVLISELHGPIFGSMMSAIESSLRTHHKHAIITAGHSDKQSELDGIDFLLSRNCDAIILHVEALSDAELVELTAQSKIPFIFINRYIKELAHQSVYLNNHLGGYLAAKNLCDNGHQKIAYISGPFWKNDASERLKGHKQALIDSHIAYDPDLTFEGDYHEDSGYLGMQSLLAKAPEITAVACGNDEMAAGAMQAIREAQKTIPADISCVGFDNIIFTRFMFPKLSTIHFPIDKMGYAAVQLVMKMRYNTNIEGPDFTHQFTPHLVERDTVSLKSSQ